MGSLQNLNRSGSSLVQLSRAAVVANQSSLAPGSGNPSLMGFNSAVGGGRITPTSSGSAASVSGNFIDYLIIRKNKLERDFELLARVKDCRNNENFTVNNKII